MVLRRVYILTRVRGDFVMIPVLVVTCVSFFRVVTSLFEKRINPERIGEDDEELDELDDELLLPPPPPPPHPPGHEIGVFPGVGVGAGVGVGTGATWYTTTVLWSTMALFPETSVALYVRI